jgi:hypothetical protein
MTKMAHLLKAMRTSSESISREEKSKNAQGVRAAPKQDAPAWESLEEELETAKQESLVRTEAKEIKQGEKLKFQYVRKFTEEEKWRVRYFLKF